MSLSVDFFPKYPPEVCDENNPIINLESRLKKKIIGQTPRFRRFAGL